MRYDTWSGRYPRAGYDAGFVRRLEGFERAKAWHGPPRDYDHEVRRVQDPSRSSQSDLAIHGPARYGLGPYHERLRRRRRPDDEVEAAVKDALFYDTWVDADAITVRVRDGVVTLEGELPSYEEVRFATDDAWDVEGVIGVRCQLRVDEG